MGASPTDCDPPALDPHIRDSMCIPRGATSTSTRGRLLAAATTGGRTLLPSGDRRHRRLELPEQFGPERVVRVHGHTLLGDVTARTTDSNE